MKKAFILSVVVILCLALIYVLYPWRVSECKRLAPGITLGDLTKKFRKPLSKSTTQGQTWYYFASDRFAAGPIMAQVEEVGGRVLVLQCTEDGPASRMIK